MSYIDKVADKVEWSITLVQALQSTHAGMILDMQAQALNPRFGSVEGIENGVVSIKGFQNAFAMEIFHVQVHDKQYIGQVINITEDLEGRTLVGGILLDSNAKVFVGASVYGTGSLASVYISLEQIGSMVDPLGNLLVQSSDNPGLASHTGALGSWLIESPAPDILSRESVYEPLQTGIFCVDTMIPIGRGQRELIIGDRQTGKTTLALDVILNQRSSEVYCVYGAIGQKASSILGTYNLLESAGATEYTTVLAGSASSSPLELFIGAYTASSIAEYYMYQSGYACLIVTDDLTKHAVAYREMYLPSFLPSLQRPRLPLLTPVQDYQRILLGS